MIYDLLLVVRCRSFSVVNLVQFSR